MVLEEVRRSRPRLHRCFAVTVAIAIEDVSDQVFVAEDVIDQVFPKFDGTRDLMRLILLQKFTPFPSCNNLKKRLHQKVQIRFQR